MLETNILLILYSKYVVSMSMTNSLYGMLMSWQAQQLTHIQFQYELMKKSQDQMEKQNNDLLQQQSHLKDRLVSGFLDWDASELAAVTLQ